MLYNEIMACWGIISFFILSFLLAGRLSVVYAGDYYLSPNGSEASGCGGGTVSSPWRTLQKAEECVPAGSNIYFKSGNYSQLFSTPGRVNFKFKGAVEKPIEIKPAPGSEGLVKIIQGLNLSGSYGSISGLDIQSNDGYIVLSIYSPGDHITIQNNKIHGATDNRCIVAFKDTDTISILNNEIYDCGTVNNFNASLGVALESLGGTHLNYSGNEIHHAHGGITIKAGASTVLIEQNVLYDLHNQEAIRGSGVQSAGNFGNTQMQTLPVPDRYQAKDIIVRNNLIYGVSNGPAIVAGGWVNYWVYNNTIFDQTSYAALVVTSNAHNFYDSSAINYCNSHSCNSCPSGSPEPCVNVNLQSKNGEIANNVVVSSADRMVVVNPASSGAGLNLSHNIYYDSGLTIGTADKFKFGSTTTYSLSGFQNAGYETGSLIADPLFVSETSNPPNLHLKSGSPGIDSGKTIASAAVDYAGIKRPQGGGYDIGAYEYPVAASSPTIPKIPTVTLTPTPTIGSGGQAVNLMAVLKNWLSGLGDTNGDGKVNSLDFVSN